MKLSAAQQVYVTMVTQLKHAHASFTSTHRAGDLEYLESQEPLCLLSMFHESSEEHWLLCANFHVLPRLK